MDTAMTALVVVAGMAFSFAVALLAEELIVGELFRVLFARQAERNSGGQSR